MTRTLFEFLNIHSPSLFLVTNFLGWKITLQTLCNTALKVRKTWFCVYYEWTCSSISKFCRVPATGGEEKQASRLKIYSRAQTTSNTPGGQNVSYLEVAKGDRSVKTAGIPGVWTKDSRRSKLKDGLQVCDINTYKSAKSRFILSSPDTKHDSFPRLALNATKVQKKVPPSAVFPSAGRRLNTWLGYGWEQNDLRNTCRQLHVSVFWLRSFVFQHFLHPPLYPITLYYSLILFFLDL